MTAITLFNDLGTEPVPMFVTLSSRRSGGGSVRETWPARWFAEPVIASWVR
jgi:hypothetical protein